MAQAQLLAAPAATQSATRITYCNLCKEPTDLDSVITWCQRRKLLAEEKDCPACGREMRLVNKKGNPEKRMWRCPRKGCRKEVSVRTGTFFAQSHLEIEKILPILHLWSTRCTVLCIMCTVLLFIVVIY